MTTIPVSISWKRNGEVFSDHRYSRKHQWIFDGGQSIDASSSPDVVPIPMSDPSAVDPEEAFVASLSSCHMLWFLFVAARSGFIVDEYRDQAIGELGKNSADRHAMTLVTLRPRVRFSGDTRPTPEVFESMHHRAHDECFIANSVNTEVRCEPAMDEQQGPVTPG